MNVIEEELLNALAAFNSGVTPTIGPIGENGEFGRLVELAQKHGVLTYLYDYSVANTAMPEVFRASIEREAAGNVPLFTRLLFNARDITKRFEEAGIVSVVLKGAAIAAYFKEPEIRKSGDIDILLPDSDSKDRAGEILEEMGFEPETEDNSLHHESFKRGQVCVELHTELTEPFDNEETNEFLTRCVAECAEHRVFKEIAGVTLPVLDDGYQAFEILLHMLGHFLRAGFGLKFLCDYCIFWNSGISGESREVYLKLIKESRIKGFSDAVTNLCISYLGLSDDYRRLLESGDTKAEPFLEEILNSGEFGTSSNDRMVSLRGDSFADLVREFHHQMHINFPKAGKVFIIWPVLWTVTLIKFLRNNAKIRKVSAGRIIKNARKRGRITKQMNLFS